MSSLRFFDLAKQHFGYLVEECGFRVVREKRYEGFDNADVVWQSEDCRISVSLERGQVFLSTAPISAPEEWYDLSRVIAYLTRGADIWQYEFPDPAHMGYDARIEWQLERLARILRPHCGSVCNLFRPGVFEQERAELLRLMGIGRDS